MSAERRAVYQKPAFPGWRSQRAQDIKGNFGLIAADP
jgi:hypothetical protein